MGVNVILQLDFSNKVIGQTKRGTQMDKRVGKSRHPQNKYLY